MEQLGIDFNATGSVMSKGELEELRRKRGECITCGRKCFQKKFFKMIPITDHGRVLNGRCLNCKPLDANENEGGLIPAVSRPATKEDLARFSRSQSNLGISGPGVGSRRRQSGISATPGRSLSAGHPSSQNRPPSRSASHSSAQAAATANAESSLARGRSTELDSSSSNRERIREASARSIERRDRSVTPNNSHRQLDGHTSHHQELESSQRGYASADSSQSRRRHSPHPGPGVETSAHGDMRDQLDGGDPYGESFDPRHPPHNDYHAGRKAVNEELSQQVRRYADDNSFSGREGGIETHPSNHRSSGNSTNRSYGGGVRGEPPRRGVTREYSGEGSFSGQLPRGTLDRGGEIAFPSSDSQRGEFCNNAENGPINSNVVAGRHPGSSKTLSSMGSNEEDLVNGRFGSHGSRYHPQNRAVYEEESIDNNSMRSREIEPPPLTHAEEEAIDRLHAANGDCAEILAIMNEHMNSPFVQSFALKEISCLHLGPEEQDRLAHHGAMDLITEAMHAYPDDIELQIHGCRAIWNGSGTQENQMAFVSAGALDIILADMDHFIDNAEVQECAMGTLSNLAASEPNLLPMIEKGTVGRVVEAMNKHSDNNLVQAKGCSAVTNMASHLSPLKTNIMEMGGGGAVVICMVMHPDDYDLQEKALRALKNLSSNNDDNKIELANIGGIDAVITAMQVHRDHAGVQEAGAWTLSNLASNNENKAVIGDCGGIDVVIRAMWVHADNVKVQEWCCRALYTLTLDRHNGGMVLQVGGISAVVNAMQAHVDSGPVQEMGCAVLCNLAFDESSKMRIVDEEALDAIVLAMVLYTDDAKVQESACEVLLQLAIVENFKSMQASNIGELARAAATKFPENCKEPAFKLLHVLEGYHGQY